MRTPMSWFAAFTVGPFMFSLGFLAGVRWYARITGH